MVTIVLATVVWASEGHAQRSVAPPPILTVAPRDDAASEPGFEQFRHNVAQAVQTCTPESLRSVLAPSAAANDITMPPSAAFWHYWTVEDEGGLRALCRNLGRAFALGAVRYGEGAFCLPYVGCAGGTPNSLPFGAYFVGVSERVRLRSRPSADADVMVEGSYPVLIDCDTPESPCGNDTGDAVQGWQRVRLNATVGYVSRDELRDQEEPSVIARRLPVGWRISLIQFAD
ncbi:MAG: hypothetical protein ABIT71_18485 [Vicinamibacteraceae bacterium]